MLIHRLETRMHSSVHRFTFALFATSVLGIFLLQSRIAVTDRDAEAYVVGARSLREGKGYVDTAGIPLNHWPPGYSMLLSVGPEAKTTALFLNYLAFGLAMVLLYNLALYAGWSWV